MTNTLLDLSGKLPLPAQALIEEIANAALLQSLPFFIVGAFARDLILEWAYRIRTQRATTDIDFGIRVENWEQFESLSVALIETGNFHKHPKQKQRFNYKESISIDIVPFGQIENAQGMISWPPQYEVEMSALGFNEAYIHSIRVLIANGVEVAVSSLVGLFLMKLISWEDRKANKDVFDLALIMTKYLEAGNAERVYGDGSPHADILQDPQFDYELTSARLLGRDMKMLLTERTTPVVIKILDTETDVSGKCRLTGMLSNHRSFDGNLNKALKMLESVKQGILDN
jgi:predicted nucleotidyltransferase